LQIPGLDLRIRLIQYMQSFGVLSFLLCALSMFSLFVEKATAGKVLFGVSLLALAVSLLFSLWEVLISTNALSVVVSDLSVEE
jgi:Na+/phosphate symporter